MCFKDGSNSNYGTAIVGTVSGTSISFGTKVVIQSANLDPIASVFDSTNNKVLFAYRNNSTNSQLIVGTVSGTSISFGSPTTYVSGQSYNQSLAHDTSSGKNVLVYRDTGNSNYGTAIVGTLSSAVPNFTIGSTYYVQDNGTLATTSSSVTAGKAIANTTLLLKG